MGDNIIDLMSKLEKHLIFMDKQREANAVAEFRNALKIADVWDIHEIKNIVVEKYDDI